VLIALETTGVPLPGETALITASIAASNGRLQIGLVIVLAAAAAILGDNTGFLLGRKLGRRVLSARGPLYRHRLALLRVGEPFFERHGAKAVFLGRWVTGLRITAAWLAGATRMRWHVFVFWNALGGIAWATSVGLTSYFVGHTAERVLSTGGLAALGLVVLAIVRRRRARRAEPVEELLDGDEGAAQAPSSQARR
jgi:membrane protein DedA with SNARE-associated domain